MANDLLRSSRVRLPDLSLGFCIISISGACISSLPFMHPSVIFCQCIYDWSIKSVTAASLACRSAGIISRAKGGPRDRRGTAISCSKSPQCPRNQMECPPWRQDVPATAQSKWALFAGKLCCSRRLPFIAERPALRSVGWTRGWKASLDVAAGRKTWFPGSG